MKLINSRLALLATLVAIFVPGELQAKVQYCSECHQPSGQGYRGATPIPRLAGQQTEYFQNQLHAFIERRRTNKFMFKVAHSLSSRLWPRILASSIRNP
jgi:cytochrome c553